MRIEDLDVFSVLAETRNLHRVAQKTGLTQSAVSKILQRLEAEFQTKLVDRSGRGVDLTAAGRVLVARAADVRASVAQTYAEMTAANSASAGQIRLGVIPALLDSAILPTIARYTNHETAISFRLSVQVSALLFDELRDGHLDLAICFSPETGPDEELQSDDIGRLPHQIVARQNHPLSNTQPGPDVLHSAKWLLPPPEHGLRQLVNRYFQGNDLPPPRAVIETNASISQVTSLVRHSDLITVLPESMLRTYLGRELVSLTSGKNLFESRVRLFYRRKAYMSPAVNKFRTAIQNAMIEK